LHLVGILFPHTFLLFVTQMGVNVRNISKVRG